MIEERRFYMPSISMLPRLRPKDEAFLGFAKLGVLRDDRCLFYLFFCNSVPYMQTCTKQHHCMFTAAACTYVAGIMCLRGRVGRGSKGLLWQYEVNQHSVHASFHYNCWGLQYSSNLQPRAVEPQRRSQLQGATVTRQTVATGGLSWYQTEQNGQADSPFSVT